MVLRRLEPWEFDQAQANAVRAAAQLREGGAAIVKYGFEGGEFGEMGNPEMWEGMAKFIYAVELALIAIESWDGVEGENGAEAPVEVGPVAYAFRIAEIRLGFLAAMEKEGALHRAQVAEGNG